MKADVSKRSRSGLMVGLFILAGCLIGAPHVQADIYYWTDDNGVIHFTNHNPPREAEFFMVEQSSGTSPPHRAKPEMVSPKNTPIEAQLTETNRKLEKALEKVNDLTEEVEKSRREARIAANVARQAQEEAKIAGESQPERTVVYSVPYGQRSHRPYPKPSYWKHDTRKYPYYNDRRHWNPHRPDGKPDRSQRNRSGASVNFKRNGIHVEGTRGFKREDHR